jgi:hypothetical protein
MSSCNLVFATVLSAVSKTGEIVRGSLKSKHWRRFFEPLLSNGSARRSWKYAPSYDFDLLIGCWVNGVADSDFADYAFYDPSDVAIVHSHQINQGLTDTHPTRNVVGFSDPIYDNQEGAARQFYDLSEWAQVIQHARERAALLRPLSLTLR